MCTQWGPVKGNPDTDVQPSAHVSGVGFLRAVILEQLCWAPVGNLLMVPFGGPVQETSLTLFGDWP